MDRVLVYDGALPQTTDVLNTNLFALLDSAFKNAALLGSSTVVAGLACTPTTPTASLQVIVATGSIFQIDEIDGTAYGDLGTNTNSVLKQGILPAPVTLTITPPSTSGFSQVYLVEAILQDIDSGATVLSYYNSANPTQPYSGPNNSGSSNFTQRLCRCTIALKAGVAASTGTQTTPSPDAGYVGLYAITVANGQSQITSTNIVQLASAPFFPTLPQVPYQVQGGTYVYAGQDTGTANAYVITFAAGQPIPAAYGAGGMGVKFKALNANTGASTVNVNGLGTVTIKRANGVALAANDITSGQVVELTYDGTNFQMQNYLGTGANTNSNTVVDIPYIADSGTQNAIVATYSPAIGSLTDGLYLAVKLANTITGACTINVSGLGAKPVYLGDGSNPPYNVYVAGMDLLLSYSTAMGAFQIANTSAGMFYRAPTANYTFYVNTSLGSDTLYDGTSATVSGTRGPFKTIGKGVTTAWGFAPSPFTITLNIAAGTYSESVQTPSWAASNIVISGAGAGSTILSSPASYSSNTAALAVSSPSSVTVQNMTIQGGNSGVVANIGGAAVNVSNVTFNGGWIIGQACWATYGGIISIGTGITISSSMNAGFLGENGGSIVFGASVNVTISSSISLTTGFAYAAVGGYVTVSSSSPPTFTNPSFVSGPKFYAFGNGTVYAQGLGVNFFPGSSAGSTASGGQYLP